MGFDVANSIYAGDGGLFKVCTVCGEAKLLSDFGSVPRGLYGKNSVCKICAAARKKAWIADNPDVYKASKTLSKIKSADKARLYRRENAEAIRERSRAYREANPEKAKMACKQWRDNNPDKERERSTKNRLANPERSRSYSDAWRKRNPERAKEVQRICSNKRRSTPRGKLENMLRGGIKRGLKVGSKQGRGTFDLLDYTAAELKVHIERQFSMDMSWENYGKGGWDVDHRIPLSSFDYQTPDCPGFKAAWALTNLQPLWGTENYSKGDKIIYLL